MVAVLPPQRGPRGRARLWNFLDQLTSGGTTDFGALRTRGGTLRRGLSIILSDFLTESDPAPAVSALRQAQQEVVLLQVLAPQELVPEVAGDALLRDVETGGTVEVTVTPALRAAYTDALEQHTLRLLALARAHGARFHRLRSDEPLETLLLDTFRRTGLLR